MRVVGVERVVTNPVRRHGVLRIPCGAPQQDVVPTIGHAARAKVRDVYRGYGFKEALRIFDSFLVRSLINLIGMLSESVRCPKEM